MRKRGRAPSSGHLRPAFGAGLSQAAAPEPASRGVNRGHVGEGDAGARDARALAYVAGRLWLCSAHVPKCFPPRLGRDSLWRPWLPPHPPGTPETGASISFLCLAPDRHQGVPSRIPWGTKQVQSLEWCHVPVVPGLSGG